MTRISCKKRHKENILNRKELSSYEMDAFFLGEENAVTVKQTSKMRDLRKRSEFIEEGLT